MEGNEAQQEGMEKRASEHGRPSFMRKEIELAAVQWLDNPERNRVGQHLRMKWGWDGQCVSAEE